jgi:hypothetical protein
MVWYLQRMSIVQWPGQFKSLIEVDTRVAAMNEGCMLKSCELIVRSSSFIAKEAQDKECTGKFTESISSWFARIAVKDEPWNQNWVSHVT